MNQPNTISNFAIVFTALKKKYPDFPSEILELILKRLEQFEPNSYALLREKYVKKELHFDYQTKNRYDVLFRRIDELATSTVACLTDHSFEEIQNWYQTSTDAFLLLHLKDIDSITWNDFPKTKEAFLQKFSFTEEKALALLSGMPKKQDRLLLKIYYGLERESVTPQEICKLLSLSESQLRGLLKRAFISFFHVADYLDEKELKERKEIKNSNIHLSFSSFHFEEDFCAYFYPQDSSKQEKEEIRSKVLKIVACFKSCYFQYYTFIHYLYDEDLKLRKTLPENPSIERQRIKSTKEKVKKFLTLPEIQWLPQYYNLKKTFYENFYSSEMSNEQKQQIHDQIDEYIRYFKQYYLKYIESISMRYDENLILKENVGVLTKEQNYLYKAVKDRIKDYLKKGCHYEDLKKPPTALPFVKDYFYDYFVTDSKDFQTKKDVDDIIACFQLKNSPHIEKIFSFYDENFQRISAKRTEEEKIAFRSTVQFIRKKLRLLEEFRQVFEGIDYAAMDVLFEFKNKLNRFKGTCKIEMFLQLKQEFLLSCYKCSFGSLEQLFGIPLEEAYTYYKDHLFCFQESYLQIVEEILTIYPQELNSILNDPATKTFLQSFTLEQQQWFYLRVYTKVNPTMSYELIQKYMEGSQPFSAASFALK